MRGTKTDRKNGTGARGDGVTKETLEHGSLREAIDQLRQAVGGCEIFPDEQLTAAHGYFINPSLELLQMNWIGLAEVLEEREDVAPQPGEEQVLVWKHPQTGAVHCRAVQTNDLLALKLVHEELDTFTAAREGKVTVGAIEAVLTQAVEDGVILRAPSRLCRETEGGEPELIDPSYHTAQVFTLQWHVTQACDLHCKHCYDRSDRVRLPFDRAMKVLDEMHRFCRHNNVRGQISFTGGNPLMYPRFKELYRAAAERGFMLALLGNPTTASIVDELISVHKPEFYQVSLEGMEAHNDSIRGEGHFQRVIEFLAVLRERQVYSMVMLTLTRANCEQVLPLAEYLRDKVDLFTFNRLTLFGEGASLQPVEQEQFETLLAGYLEAAATNPVMSLKDNLLNRHLCCTESPLFGGCAGFGCGAAFNFVSILPDGEVHACRKFPSYLGNIFEQDLEAIYRSPLASRYRAGSEACGDCRINLVCRGCPAVVAGHGLDPFVDRDPYCPEQLLRQPKK